MKKNLGDMACIYPMPVFIITTYNEDGTPNAMNAAWGGISCDTEIMICMGDNHQTTSNLRRNPDFVIHMGTADYVKECDFLGDVSGKEVPDKVARAGFTVTHAEHVNAPMINELPMALECRMTSYDPETCHMFADIINVCADESVLTDDKIDVTKVRPITYDPSKHQYVVLGEVVGHAFKDGLELK